MHPDSHYKALEQSLLGQLDHLQHGHGGTYGHLPPRRCHPHSTRDPITDHGIHREHPLQGSQCRSLLVEDVPAANLSSRNRPSSPSHKSFPQHLDGPAHGLPSERTRLLADAAHAHV